MTPRVAEHSEDLGAAESAESAGLIGIGGGIVGNGTGTEGQRTIRTDRTCGSWKAGKCREPGGNPEGEGRGRCRERENDDGGNRSIGSGETRKVNRDDRKRRKTEGRSKVDTEAHGSARGRSVPERPKSQKSREGRKRECRPREISESSAEAETPRLEKRTPRGMKIDLNKVKVVEEVPESSAEAETPRKSRMGEGKEGRWEASHIVGFGLGSENTQAETGPKGSRKTATLSSSDSGPRPRKPELDGRKECGRRPRTDLIKAENDSAEGQDRKWRTRIGEWNEKSRSLMDQYSISEARRFGVGVVATSERGRDVQLGRKILAKSNGLETRRLVEGNVNAKSSKVGSEVGSDEIRDGVG
ncbi:hypothetical protein DFH06DRAFT_1150353 [Mycena polygramma]|nr:hypothetical protein DFH06DRAFT_1150353 [Mycena polygramma]